MHLSLILCFALTLTCSRELVCLGIPISTGIDVNQNFTSVLEKSLKPMLQSLSESFMDIPNDEIWKQIPDISIASPFFFFHQRKSGGSSIRYQLKQVAKYHGLKSDIACFDVNCDVYEIASNSRAAIYAGHLRYGSQDNIQRLDERSRIRTNISCATNFREQLSRLLSCFMFRFNIPCISHMSLEGLRILLSRTDEYGNSCLNEPFRIMSGVLDEDAIDHLRMGNHSNHHLLRILYMFKSTLINVASCSPIVLEIPESYELLADRYPRLFRNESTGANAAFDPTVQIRPGKFKTGDTPQSNHEGSRENCSSATESQMEILKEYTHLEQLLYDTVRKKVQSRVDEKYPHQGTVRPQQQGSYY